MQAGPWLLCKKGGTLRLFWRSTELRAWGAQAQCEVEGVSDLESLGTCWSHAWETRSPRAAFYALRASSCSEGSVVTCGM